MFACQPAPLQITWLGYPNTTGLRTIKYRVTDAITDPVTSCQRFTEELYRLPTPFLCFDVAWINNPETPPVSPLPSDEHGYVTFGSFSNSLAKMQQGCLELWAQVLTAVPTSRLCLKASKCFSMPDVSVSQCAPLVHVQCMKPTLLYCKTDPIKPHLTLVPPCCIHSHTSPQQPQL